MVSFCRAKNWDVLDKTGAVGYNLCQGKDNFKSGGIF